MYTLNDLHVVVVEPSAVQRRIIVDALYEAGILHTEEADSGAQALKLLFELSPDLVISSLYLPDMTGTELVEQIRHSESHHDTAFMLISSETRFRYLDPIRQAGSVGILPKPFSRQELMIALQAVVDMVDPDRLSLGEERAESLRVLVVDDSPLAVKHISRVLQKMDIPAANIDSAENGEQALQKVNTNYYDFVVSDYNMPVMDGVELVDRIRKESTQSSIPILMVTSETDSNRLAAVQRAGVAAICDKPFDPGTVRQLISQIVSS